MREIKFRAWDKEEKFMLQDIHSMYDGSCNHKETEERYGWISCFDSFIDNDNYVVMQYTGLKDKNGTEIYEGDILSTDNGTRSNTGQGLVKEYKGMYVSFYGQDILERDCHDALNRVCNAREVIGNIWENPELLK